MIVEMMRGVFFVLFCIRAPMNVYVYLYTVRIYNKYVYIYTYIINCI